MRHLLLPLSFLLTLSSLSAAYSVPSARTIKLPINKELPDFESFIRESNLQRITGGELVQPTDIPYAAGILVQGTIGTRWCGGALISPNFVLSTASCLILEPIPITALLGASNMSTISDPVPVLSIQVHIEYDPEAWQNDIALLQLSRAANVGVTIQPARLPNWRQLQSPFTNQLATASGWGALWHNAPEVLPLNDLRRVRLPVISNINCAIRFPGWITENQICVATDNGSPCHGDQGGPLTVADPDGRTTLIGLFAYTSFLGCNSGWPAVFTRITPYLLWISTNSDVTILDDFEY